MSRRVGYAVAALSVVAATGVGWYGGRSRPAAELVADGPDLPHAWQWKVHDIPDIGATGELGLVVRTHFDPVAAAAGVPPLTDHHLRPGEGTDRVVAREYVDRALAVRPRVSLQLLDRRRLGFGAADEARGPLRAVGVVRTADAGAPATCRLGGHSVRGNPLLDPAAWAAGELPLLTITTVGVEGQFTHTFLLTARGE